MPDKSKRGAPACATPTVAEQIIRAWLDAGAPMVESDGFAFNAAENITAACSVEISPGRSQLASQEEAWDFLFGNGSRPRWDPSGRAIDGASLADDTWLRSRMQPGHVSEAYAACSRVGWPPGACDEHDDDERARASA